MSDIKKYNIFIFFSTISRSILELYSCVMLYKVGYDVRDIFLFFLFSSLVCIFVNFFTMYFGNKYNYNVLLIFSTFIYILSFYYFINMSNNFFNLIIFSILLSFSSSIYNIIRHYLAINSINNNFINNISIIIILNYLAIIISSFLTTFINNNYILIIFVLISSLLGIIPLLKQSNLNKDKIIYDLKSIDKNKILFFILEQSKVILLSLQPLYLYINLNNDYKFIGIFNIVISVISIIFIYFFSKKINKKYFIFINILFSLILLIKINIFNKKILLFIAILEAIGIKVFELISHNNLYNINIKDNRGYIIIVETIFNVTKFILFLIFYIFHIDLYIIILICIILIFICSFIKVI